MKKYVDPMKKNRDCQIIFFYIRSHNTLWKRILVKYPVIGIR